jgi:prenyltransferase beta subunit
MTNRIIRLIYLIIALSFTTHGVCHAGKREGEKKFNFAKTRAFMGEMETRPDFPVSTVLANDYVISVLALDGKIKPARKGSIVSWIKSAQNRDGGFSADRSDRNSSLLFTDISLETLRCLKLTDAIDLRRVKKFTASLKNSDGGFGLSSGVKESSLAATYHAAKILKSTGAIGLMDKFRTVGFVKSFEGKDGGFGYVRGSGVADTKSTYMALFILNSLGMMDRATTRMAEGYLNKCAMEELDLDGHLHLILALKELGVDTKIGREPALAFLQKIYVPFNGGFGPSVGYGSTPDSTAAAIRILAELGKLKTPQAPAIPR